MDNRVYWIWLQQSVGSAYDIKSVIDFFGNAKNIYDADEADLAQCSRFKRKSGVRDRLLDKDLKRSKEIIEQCNKYKISVLTPESEEYPKNLLEIFNYPLVLYVRGEVSVLRHSVIFGVIGSRTPSLYGEKAATKIVSGLVKEENALIVSGGAVGIDSVAHKTAMENGGKTVLVMGCGHGCGYLPENSSLRKQVSQNGALITEYPPFSDVERNTFPERNRIISALSRAVVIIEAADRSGTFSTARHARRQGKDLFVLPGDIESGNFTGSNQLLSEGARPVFSHTDILSFYFPKKYLKEKLIEKDGNPFPRVNKKSPKSKRTDNKNPSSEKQKKKDEKNEEIKENIKKNLPETISKNAEIVYNIMSDGVLTLDSIERRSGMETRKVLAALTELELELFICSDGPGTYKII